MAPDRVYLHVGAPKTGTTYLQALLAANRAALRAGGILYPSSVGEAQHTAVWELRGTPPQREGARGIEGAWPKLVHRVNAWDGSAAVVSSELFVYCDAEQIRTALAAFDADVHIVYTARDLVRQVPAVWQERVKNQQTITYPDFVRAVTTSQQGSGGRAFWRAQDAAEVAGRWSVGLPPAQVHIVTTPPSGSPPDVLWDRFVSVFGGRGLDYSTAIDGLANRSLGWLQTELLRRYNERHGSSLPWPVYRRTIRAEVESSFADAIHDGRRIDLPASDVAFFTVKAQSMVGRLRRAGYDVVGDLDDLLPAAPGRAGQSGAVQSGAAQSGAAQSDAAQSGAPPTEQEVLDAALDVLHAVLTREQQDRQQRRAGRRQKAPAAGDA